MRELLCEPGLAAGYERAAAFAAWAEAVGAPGADEALLLAGALAFPEGVGGPPLLPIAVAAPAPAGESPQARYDAHCREALRQAAAGRPEAAFEVLRAAAAIDDRWARHHHLYGLVHGAQVDPGRARFELGLALRAEPHADARRRIAQALAVPEREVRLRFEDTPAWLEALEAHLAAGRSLRLTLEAGPPPGSALWNRLRLCRGAAAVASALGGPPPPARSGLGRLADWASSALGAQPVWARYAASLRPATGLGPAVLRLEPEEAP